MNMPQTETKLVAGWEILEIQPPKQQPTDVSIIMLHGYGAQYRDLVGLSQAIVPDRARWIFVNAPIKLNLGHGTEGRAWFPIDWQAWEQAVLKTGAPPDLRHIKPPELEQNALRLLGLIRDLNIHTDKLLIGGFSQGAMQAMELFLQLRGQAKMLALLTGTLISADHWEFMARSLVGTSSVLFQSHGWQDQVLSMQGGQYLKEFIEKHTPYPPHFEAFQGQHEIPANVLSALAGLVETHLCSP